MILWPTRLRSIACALLLGVFAFGLPTRAQAQQVLAHLGSTAFTVVPEATTAAYTQSGSGLVFNGAFALGDTLGGTFAPQDWRAYVSPSHEFGVVMTLTGANPDLAFSVQFYDANYNVINTYGGTTVQLVAGTPTFVPLIINIPGTGVLTSVAGIQFTWDGGGSVNVLVGGVAAAGTAAPSITSPLSASGTAGAPFSYQIAANNSPTSYSVSGLPAGLIINSASGAITGTPTAAGTSTVTLSATNAGGTGTAILVLTIAPAPTSTPTPSPTPVSTPTPVPPPSSAPTASPTPAMPTPLPPSPTPVPTATPAPTPAATPTPESTPAVTPTPDPAPIDQGSPSLRITEPTAANFVTKAASYTLRGSATDDIAPTKLEYRVISPDGRDSGWQTGSLAGSGRTRTWAQPVVLSRAGTWVVRLRASDAAGKLSAVATRSVVVDRTPPSVSVTSPARGSISTSGRALILKGVSKDNLTPLRVEIRVQPPRGRYGGWETVNLPGQGRSKGWSRNVLLSRIGEWKVQIRALDQAANASAVSQVTIKRR